MATNEPVDTSSSARTAVFDFGCKNMSAGDGTQVPLGRGVPRAVKLLDDDMGTEVWEGVVGGALLGMASLGLFAQLGSTGIGGMGARGATLFLMCRGGEQGVSCTAGMLRCGL